VDSPQEIVQSVRVMFNEADVISSNPLPPLVRICQKKKRKERLKYIGIGKLNHFNLEKKIHISLLNYDSINNVSPLPKLSIETMSPQTIKECHCPPITKIHFIK
jgi:hypothetical protein